MVASVVDDDGNQVYPRKWNHEFMDIPLVEKVKQNTPTFSAEVMTGLVNWKKPRESMLFILCGAGGFRISEMLGIEIEKHISSDFRTIHIRQQARHCKVKEGLKTTNALRDGDLHPAIALLLRAFVRDRKIWFSVHVSEWETTVIIEHHPSPLASSPKKPWIREPLHRKP